MNLFWFLRSKKTVVSTQTIENIKEDWADIKVLLEGKQPSQLKQALIIADKTLDAALKDIAVGENMGERLKNAKDRFDPVDYDKIWKAHKTRNNLVHESGYDLPYFVATACVEDIKRGLEVLGVHV